MPVAPSAECAELWADSAARGLLDGLISASSPGLPVWVDYGFEQGAFVIDAGDSEAGNHCLGVVQAGEVLGFSAQPVEPKLLTRLYGYHFPWLGNGGPLDPLVAISTQPQGVVAWLDGLGVPSAVIVPVEVVGLPFEISTALKVSTAIHEAFHVEVQMPRWVGPGGDWPVWDFQPARSEVRACYSNSPAVETAMIAERAALYETTVALMGGDSVAACTAGIDFLQRRAERHDLLDGFEVPRHDGTPGSCEEAEAIMELEEGTADYGSWAALFNKGIVSTEGLKNRYRARQAEQFYLTGAMQLHSVELMFPERFLFTTLVIAQSRQPAGNTLTDVFEQNLEAYCH